MTQTPTYRPPNPRDVVVRNVADLSQFWESVVGPDGFDDRCLWLAMFDDDGRPLPILIPIDGVPPAPDGLAGNLLRVVNSIADEHDVAALAALLARPGSAVITSSDRRWADLFTPRSTRIRKIWPAHLATRGRVVQLDPPNGTLTS